MRVVPKRMIETKVPMIDVFNCLVESQKIPIFSVAGEPYNQLLARIGIQADAEDDPDRSLLRGTAAIWGL